VRIPWPQQQDLHLAASRFPGEESRRYDPALIVYEQIPSAEEVPQVAELTMQDLARASLDDH
jgi:hypothetical protein